METFIIVIFIHFHTLFIPTFFFISANDHQKGNMYDISKQCIYKDGNLQKKVQKCINNEKYSSSNFIEENSKLSFSSI